MNKLRHNQTLHVGTTQDPRVTIKGNCMVTGKPFEMKVDYEELQAWWYGTLIQNAMPNVSPPEREFLVSGTSPEGFKQLFGEHPSIFE